MSGLSRYIPEVSKNTNKALGISCFICVIFEAEMSWKPLLFLHALFYWRSILECVAQGNGAKLNINDYL